MAGLMASSPWFWLADTGIRTTLPIIPATHNLMDDDIFRAQSSIDYFECDIYVGTGAKGWQLVTDPQVLLDWEARLFAFIAERTAGFIWNRDPLRIFSNTGKLRARRSSNKGSSRAPSKDAVLKPPVFWRIIVPRISGWMMHDDAVDDEWLAVWVLREATKQFPDIIVSVRDADGEFLLAEAAMQIPLWLTPENSANRVFIYNGHLHIVPLDVSGTENISLELALQSQAAEKEAFARLDEYPEKLKQSVHRSRCRVPVKVAKALSQRPQLIAAATALFYARDPTQTKLAKRMRHFPAEPSVMTTVAFNRIQYAKLASQSIDVDYQLPKPESPDYKACVMGMKIEIMSLQAASCQSAWDYVLSEYSVWPACGFEILNAELARMPAQAQLWSLPRIATANAVWFCLVFPVFSAAYNQGRHAHVRRATLQHELIGPSCRIHRLLPSWLDSGLTATWQKTSIGTPAYARLVSSALWHVSEKERLRTDANAASSGWLTAEATQSCARALENSEWDPSTAAAADEEDDDSWLTLRPEQLDAIMSKAESILREDPLKQVM
ncbi:SGT1-domain-containing protein [Linderina pennispora]|uniref:SGT1-domain-containing protein n=1 Tax=Linderina pennispora TaxID=61395 RepID=A0A1Y1W440_9FUNG|nr:SGT1-domain-containing protein [Linderina pennispora]ORX68291.1 SGT1-domain-containing protein [Linderina pennispora]